MWINKQFSYTVLGQPHWFTQTSDINPNPRPSGELGTGLNIRSNTLRKSSWISSPNLEQHALHFLYSGELHFFYICLWCKLRDAEKTHI